MSLAKTKTVIEFYEQGLCRLRAGNFTEAVLWLEAATSLQPQHLEARAALSLTYHELGCAPEMLAAFEELSALDAADAERLFVMAVALYDAGDYPAARRHVRNSLRLRPDWALAHYVRGRVLLAMRRFLPAKLAFVRALKLDPDLRVVRDLLTWTTSYLSLDESERRLMVLRGPGRLHQAPFELSLLETPPPFTRRLTLHNKGERQTSEP